MASGVEELLDMLFDSDGQSRMVAESVAQELAAGLTGKEI